MRAAAMAGVAAVFAASMAAADTVRWVNAAGGSWTVPGNWDLGRVPTSNDLVQFDLGGTYTVTVPASPGVSANGIDVLGGSVTLAAAATAQGYISLSFLGGNAHRVYVGDGVSPATLTLQNTTIQTSSSPLEIRPQATLTTLTGASYYSNNVLRVPSGATLRVNGGGVNPGQLLIEGGLAVVTDGVMTGEIVTVSAGSTVRATGTNARFSFFDALTLRGLVDISQGARLTQGVASSSLPVTAQGCDLRLSRGARAILPNGFRGDAATTVMLSSDAQWSGGNSSDEYRGPFIAGPEITSVLNGTYYAALELDQAAINTQSLFTALQGGLTATVDGVIHPAVFPVLRRATQPGGRTVVSGTLTIRARNANQLRIGDVIPILEYNQTAQGAFSQIIVPTLGGGRILQVYSEGTPLTVYARIVQGPPSCYPDADFDGDSDVGTDQDIEAFFRCLAGTCCQACASADFNGDGDVGTDQDIEAFFRVLAGQSC